MLEVKNLTKKFKNFELDNVSFKLEPGYIMGFIGPRYYLFTSTRQGTCIRRCYVEKSYFEGIKAS